MAKITDWASVILNTAFWAIYYYDDLDLAAHPTGPNRAFWMWRLTEAVPLAWKGDTDE